MTAARETILAVVSHEPNRRTVLAVREFQEKPIVLRTESFSQDIGWYAQQELTLNRAELSGLKNVLGIQIPRSCERATQPQGSDSTRHILSFAEGQSRRA